MKTKRILALTVCLVTTLAITACGKSEGSESESQVSSGSNQLNVSNAEAENSKLDNCLPFGLKFGDPYEKFANKLKEAGLSDAEIPQLEKAQNNNRYVGLPQLYFISVNADDYLGYTTVGSDVLKLPATMRFAFSFNQDKELYEWYWFGGNLELNDEAQVEYVLNCQIDTYNDAFGFEGSYSETNDEIVCIWETDTIGAELSLRNNILVLVFHSIEHDLNH